MILENYKAEWLVNKKYGFINFRQLPLGSSKYLSIYRCGRISELTKLGMALLKEKYNIYTLIDLQTELEHTQNRDLLKKTFNYFNVPLQNSSINEKLPTFQTYIDNYKSFISNNQKSLADVMHILANCPRFTNALIGCTMGKDRTGIVTAILMKLANKSETEIKNEYSLSKKEIQKEADLFNDHWLKRGISKSDYLKRLNVDPSVILRILDYVNLKYESVEKFLVGGGIGLKEINLLKDKIL